MNEASRAGYGRALWSFLYYSANSIFQFRRFEIIYLTRDFLAPLDVAKYTDHSSRLATEDDLEKMRADGTWDLSEDLIDGFRRGDRCLLSFVGGKLAGYTWVHVAGRPKLIPGLQISIPEDYGYNFAGFTLPEFRGCGLQPYRHHEILKHPEWDAKKGMIGYVECTNWSSRRGQTKSGYQNLGYLTLMGTRNRFLALLSADLRKLGIRRLHD